MNKFITLLCVITVLFQKTSFSQAWGNLNTGTTNVLNAVHFSDANNGCIVGVNNIVSTTTDGGNTWTSRTSGFSSLVSWNGVHFTSPNNGVIVGPLFAIGITSNGGSTWTYINSNSSYSLNAVHFASATNGCAVGAGGSIVTTTNSGNAWTLRAAGNLTVAAWRGVHFSSTSIGWTVGDDGKISKTIDGGTTWTAQTSGTTQDLYDVHFTSSTQGWAVGANGTILVTTNGGASWASQTSGTTNVLKSVHFTSSTQGWAVGANGTILITSNGGTTWSIQSPPPFFNASLNAIHMNSSTLGWAAGVGAIRYCSAPAQPGTITSPSLLCTNSTQTFSVAAVSGATSYSWSFSSSAITGTSSTNVINVNVGSTTGFASVYVTANNGNCLSPSTIKNFTLTASPAQPTAISGLSNPCVGSTTTYSVATVSGATSYSWSLAGTWPGTSTTNTISSTVGASGGTISVRAKNTNCTSVPRTLTVTVNTIPAAPTAISGLTAACANTSQTYSVASVSGATSYSWTLPNGWTGSSTSNSIAATTNTLSGNINVRAINVCGNSSAVTKSVTINQIPAPPVSVLGATTLCSNATAVFSVSAVSGATSYTWNLPSGWTGASSSNTISATTNTSTGTKTIAVSATNSCGTSSSTSKTISVIGVLSTPASITQSSTTNTICVGTVNNYTVSAVSGATSYSWTLPGGWTGASTTTVITTTAGINSGNISVTANNSCGSSSPRTLNVFVNSIPLQPGSISGATLACSGLTQVYQINPVLGATSYSWNLPSGWLGTSTSNSISATTGSSGGNVSVLAINNCGNSSSSILNITLSGSGSAPSAPTNVVGTSTICSGSATTYSVNAVSGATSYGWILPGGWSGTSTTNTINTSASNSSGNVIVTANNNCGSSAPVTFSVTSIAIPTSPTNISGAAVVCEGSTNTYSVALINGANSYSWNLPGGWIGTSTTNTINSTSTTSSGLISVSGNNACGNSPVTTLSVTVNSNPDLTVSSSGLLLTANETSATYQWIDCNNGNAIIPGETNQTFTATSNGSYAVIVTRSVCSGTSTCNVILTLDLNIAKPKSEFVIYPNPNNGSFTIEASSAIQKIIITTITGQKVYEEDLHAETSTHMALSHLEKGIYFVTVIKADKNYSVNKFNKL